MFAGEVVSTDAILLLLLAMASAVLIGFLVGRWWVLLLAFVPMAFGYVDFLLIAGLLALGVGPRSYAGGCAHQRRSART